MQYEMQLDLLRPIEELKPGLKVINKLNPAFAGVLVSTLEDQDGWFPILSVDNNFVFSTRGNIRLAPLCWVEGKPVYKGDVLWHTSPAVIRQGMSKHVVTRIEDNSVWAEDGMCASIEDLTWVQPKAKKSGWVNIYPDSSACYRYATKELADEAAGVDRIACAPISWEE